MSQPITVTVNAEMSTRHWRKLIEGQLRTAEAIFGFHTPVSLAVCACDEGEGQTKITIGPAGAVAAEQKQEPARAKGKRKPKGG